MSTIVQFVVKHGYYILFAAMFAHQIGLPIPGPLFLLAAGALAATRKLALIPALGLTVIACVMADWMWYEAGRRRGIKVLHFIHRLSRDPEFHDRRAQQVFARYGLQLLLVAKFVPGLDAVSPPLAGISRTSRLRFLAFDAAGASAYACAYALLGYVFRHNLDLAAAYIGRTGRVLGGLALLALSIYLLRRMLQRHRLVREFHARQVEPDVPIACGNTVKNEQKNRQIGLHLRSSKHPYKQINARVARPSSCEETLLWFE